MQQLIKLPISTPWGHLQAYKIWYHTRYICCYYVRDPVVYSTLVLKCSTLKYYNNRGKVHMIVLSVWIDIYMHVRGICVLIKYGIIYRYISHACRYRSTHSTRSYELYLYCYNILMYHILTLAYCKPWDPVGSNNRCTL